MSRPGSTTAPKYAEVWGGLYNTNYVFVTAGGYWAGGNTTPVTGLQVAIGTSTPADGPTFTGTCSLYGLP